MSRWLFLPNTVLGDLAILARLEYEQIDNLKAIIDQDLGGDQYGLYLRIADTLKISDQDAASLHSFWDYVQDERISNQKSGAEAVAELIAFLRSATVQDAEVEGVSSAALAKQLQTKKQRVANLFGDYPNREHALKMRLLESGPLPHLASFRTFCDLRPIFDKSGSSITDFVPIITLRMRLHGYRDKHEEVIFQTTERHIENIEEELKRLRKKLARLRERFPGVLGEAAKKTKTKGA